MTPALIETSARLKAGQEPTWMKSVTWSARMRSMSQQLVVVVESGRFRGVVTLSDVLPRLLPRPDGTVAATTVGGPATS